MIKKILITWIKYFLYLIAISYLVSLCYKEFAPVNLLVYLIGSLFVAIILELIKAKKLNH